MKISLFPPLSIHEIGQRTNQEDSIAQWDNRLFVLCDGMGGHEKGEVASQVVCQSLVRWFSHHANPDDIFTDDLLAEAIEYAYTQLDEYAGSNPRQMGTTLTLLYIHRKGMTAAHMGDSRIYHIRPNVGILYQSRDHSLVYDLYQAGEITFEEMNNSVQKNIVTRAMTPGNDNRMRPDIIHITDVKTGDWFYLCSDGMLELMSNDDLVALLSSDAPDDEIRQQLIVSTANSQDNHSAWLIHIKDVMMEEDDEHLVNEESTAQCNALNIFRRQEDDVIVVEKVEKTKTFLQRIKKVVNYIMSK
ncbi:MAG: serine/threonine-protein phosphatase [Prevotella sp.]|nr:serine/threonine-protein phosphatase [Prevotella sp.]